MSRFNSTSPALTARSRHVVLLVVVGAALFFFRLGRLPLVEPDEGRNAEVAREMLVTHDWITPHYDGLPYLDKPALFFWTVAGAFRVFGASEWPARLPAALAALGTVLLAWLVARRMFGETPGVFAGIILATSPLFLCFARTVIFDMPLTFFVTAALVCLWLNRTRKYTSVGLDVIAFAAMGAGALTKGPVAFLLPLITLAAYHALAGTTRELRRVHWGAGWTVFLVVTLPWLVTVSLRNPGFPRYAFWEESLLRFTTGAHLRRSSSVFYYIPVFFAGFFPWSFFLIFRGWKRLSAWRAFREEARQAELFLLTWAGVIFVFFTLSRSKLPGYVLPALVPLSILTGKAWQATRPGRESNPPRGLAAGFAALMVCGALVAAFSESLRSIFATAFSTSRIPPSVAYLLRPALLHGGVVAIALGLLGWRLLRRQAVGWVAFATAALAVPLLAICLRDPLAAYARIDSSRELAQTMEESPEKNFPVYGYYYFRTGLPFYLKRPVGLVSEDGGQTTSNYIAHRFAFLVGTPGERITGSRDLGLLTPAPLIHGTELDRLLDTSRRPFLLMARNSFVASLLSDHPRMEPLWTAWRFSILRVAARQAKPAGSRERVARVDSQSLPDDPMVDLAVSRRLPQISRR